MTSRIYSRPKAGTASLSFITPMRSGALQRKCACNREPGSDGVCEECRKNKLQRKANSAEHVVQNRRTVPPIVHEVLRSPGRSLDEETRAFMEPRFGHNFSCVRIHNDSRAAASVEAVDALAYTVGSHVVFGHGQYEPSSLSGQRLLAHELTHVTQQERMSHTGLSNVAIEASQGALEREADRQEQTITSSSTASDRGASGGSHALIAKSLFRTGSETGYSTIGLQTKPTFSKCNDQRIETTTKAIASAKSMAALAASELERDFPLSHVRKAQRAHFGDVSEAQKNTVAKRFQHMRDTLDDKEIECASAKKCNGKGADFCAKGEIPGKRIYLCPDFGGAKCIPDVTILHEAAHNAGAAEDIDKGVKYPPKEAENNAYSFEYFAEDLRKGPPQVDPGRKKDVDIQILKKQSRGAAEITDVPASVHEVLSSPGQPLHSATRAFMEASFGHDFSQVRVHANSKAAKSARDVNARAYTLGQDIVFAAGEYPAETRDAKRLLAHELTHVIQQRRSKRGSSVGRTVVPSTDAAEAEADSAAGAVMAGHPIKPVKNTAQQLAREAASKTQRRACVSSERIPDKHLGIQLLQGNVYDIFQMNIDWNKAGQGCDCSCGQYRQFVKGHIRINGRKKEKSLFGGAQLEENVYHEDAGDDGVPYGHRDTAETPIDKFSANDRATGCSYRGSDQPGLGAPPGTYLDMFLQFKGQSYDVCTKTFGPINEWKSEYNDFIP